MPKKKTAGSRKCHLCREGQVPVLTGAFGMTVTTRRCTYCDGQGQVQDSPAIKEGVDLRKAIPKFWAVLMKVTKSPAQTKAPTVVFHRRGRGGGFSYDNRDRVTVSTRASMACTLQTLLHELCHKAVGNHHNHDEVFVNTLFQACVAVWGRQGVTEFRQNGYDFDRKYVTALNKLEAEAILAPLGLTKKKEPAEAGPLQTAEAA